MSDDREHARQIVSRIKKIDWDKIDKDGGSSDSEVRAAPKVEFDNPMGKEGPANRVNHTTAPMDFPRSHPGVWKTTTGTRLSFTKP